LISSNLLAEIELGGTGFLPLGYEAGNIVAKCYNVEELPAEAVLARDLAHFLDIYRECVEVRNEILVEEPNALNVSTTRPSAASKKKSRPPVFRPKDSSDYYAHVPEQMQRKTHKHEGLVESFGAYLKGAGLKPVTSVHPRDMVASCSHGGPEVLVEVKTVGSNAEHAVREAIGQLFSYRHFYYRERGLSEPVLVAAFSTDVGAALRALLESLGIESCWLLNGFWRGWVPSCVEQNLIRVDHA
jgi:hypothetical protein